MPKRIIHLSIGGNLGEREANLEETRMFISFNFGDILAVSSIYESEGWKMENVPSFLNQVVKIESELSDKELIEEIADLEEFYGRERSSETYLSREMDVDILMIDNEIIDTISLKVPHPKMLERRFVLVPFNEIAEDVIHPVMNKSIKELLEKCEDKSDIKKI